MSDESEIILHYSDDSDEEGENQLVIDDQNLTEEEITEDKPEDKPIVQPSGGLVISEVRSLNETSNDSSKKVSPIRIKLVSLDLLKDSTITEEPTIIRKRKLSETEEFVPPEEPFIEEEMDFIVDIKPTQLTEQMPPIVKSSNRRKNKQKPIMDSEFTFLEPTPGPSSRVADYSMDAFENGNMMSNSYDLYSNKETIRRIAFMRVEANYLLSCLGKRPIAFTNNIVPDL